MFTLHCVTGIFHCKLGLQSERNVNVPSIVSQPHLAVYKELVVPDTFQGALQTHQPYAQSLWDEFD